MTKPSKKARVLELAEKFGVVSRRDIREAELPGEYLSRLADEGELVGLAPGVYMHADHEPGEHLEYAVVSKKLSHGVIFGISALQFHDVTTQIAHSIQLAIERGKWEPTLEWPTIEVFHISEEAFSVGVERHVVEGSTEVRVYSVPKTIADLFKFRNTFGLDVAIEALREGWRQNLFSMDELTEYADVCRVRNVMRPYLEMLG